VSRSTVVRLLRRHALGPLPNNGRSLTWSQFLGQYTDWVVQQLRNLSVQHDHLPRFILHHRDGKFSEAFDAFAEVSGSKILKLPPRSPNLNAYAERWVRSVREECLDQIIVLSERHLRYVLKEYVGYFMKRRPHQGLKQQLPDSPEEPLATGRIGCRQVLGGLIKDYYREAA
jgi:putative transposase